MPVKVYKRSSKAVFLTILLPPFKIQRPLQITWNAVSSTCGGHNGWSYWSSSNTVHPFFPVDQYDDSQEGWQCLVVPLLQFCAGLIKLIRLASIYPSHSASRLIPESAEYDPGGHGWQASVSMENDELRFCIAGYCGLLPNQHANRIHQIWIGKIWILT